MLLFIVCNFIILTVELTVTKLLILTLITIFVLHVYKRFKQSLSIDRISIKLFAADKQEG